MKTLTIRDEVYRKLVSVKEQNESFSELFERLVERQSPADLLSRLRGRIELDKEKKRKLLLEISRGRTGRRL